MQIEKIAEVYKVGRETKSPFKRLIVRKNDGSLTEMTGERVEGEFKKLFRIAYDKYQNRGGKNQCH